MSFDTIILNGCPKKVWFDLQYGLVFTASKKQKKTKQLRGSCAVSNLK